MNTEFFTALELLEKEKGIKIDYMLEKVHQALISAYKRDQGGNTNVKVIIDAAKKDIRMYQLMEVVEEVTDEKTQISADEALKISRKYSIGDTAEVEIKPKNFRRLSASTAKQVIIQGIREAERGIMIQEYEEKKEEIITATVHKIDPVSGNVIVDTGTSIATILKTEQIPGETFIENQKIKVFVMEVKKDTTKGPIVTLSRTHSGLVKRLFELEVPEIQDGVVVIMGIIREAGSRTKMAVMSRDNDVDPTGACIGSKSMRIAKIVDELRGEKIDIIKYSETPAEYIKAALAPAVVKAVVMDAERSSRVYVDSDQLSLAIGKEGQNVRLAAHLTGCKIDIKTE
ncbi:MAG: transcription termination factor NusA [Oscillospiraceae bacterium]|nr:transcription termination factor NusA [Oscillospiraceae bacterium]